MTLKVTIIVNSYDYSAVKKIGEVLEEAVKRYCEEPLEMIWTKEGDYIPEQIQCDMAMLLHQNNEYWTRIEELEKELDLEKRKATDPNVTIKNLKNQIEFLEAILADKGKAINSQQDNNPP
jgi:hypothetical protein